MIRAVIAVLLLALAAACGKHEEPTPAPRPALWAIEDAQGSAKGWLFGTIHSLPPGTAWTTPAIDQAIAAADTLVVEVRDLHPERMATLFRRVAADEPVPPLARRIPRPLYDQVIGLLAQEGVSKTAYDRVETWAAALMLARLGREDESGSSVDAALVARFRERPVAELEGAERQFAVFDDMPEPDQQALLASVLAERDDSQANPEAIARAWRSGDLETVERVSRRGLLSHPALHRALATDRNAAWAAQIVSLIESGRKPFVAVGTAHMLGTDSLPALLSARGYRVRRIQ